MGFTVFLQATDKGIFGTGAVSSSYICSSTIVSHRVQIGIRYGHRVSISPYLQHLIVHSTNPPFLSTVSLLVLAYLTLATKICHPGPFLQRNDQWKSSRQHRSLLTCHNDFLRWLHLRLLSSGFARSKIPGRQDGCSVHRFMGHRVDLHAGCFELPRCYAPALLPGCHGRRRLTCLHHHHGYGT